MSKNSTINGPAAAPFRSFYRPHLRSATWSTGEVVDQKTGELVKLPSRTKQSFVGECDINNILKQYKLTGQIRHISSKAALGSYQDLPDPLDFQESMNIVIEAEKSFATLPAHVRARFGNDPVNFLTFMADPANQDEVIKLGLATDNRPPPLAGVPRPGASSGGRSPAHPGAKKVDPPTRRPLRGLLLATRPAVGNRRARCTVCGPHPLGGQKTRPRDTPPCRASCVVSYLIDTTPSDRMCRGHSRPLSQEFHHETT